MENKPSDERLLTPAEAADLLQVAEGTLRNKARQRVIPSVKIGRSLRFRRSALLDYIEAQSRPAETAAA
jgi:excisionase family DNA binding protein